MYESKAKTTSITATSRGSVKIKENFYTIECSESRSIPDIEGVDVSQEWAILFDELNVIVDNQVGEIIKTFKGN